MALSFNFVAVGVFVGISLTFDYGLETGGPVVMVWGWVLSFIFTVFTSLSLSEICSSYPTAGSVYHWAAILAGSTYKWTSILAFICGWLNFIGYIATGASFAYGFAEMTQSCILLYSDHMMFSSPTFLVFVSVGVTFIWAVFNCLRIDE
jgi:amino acid transporter